jgi:pyridoxal 5'-phosphate synthase pdxS subunit
MADPEMVQEIINAVTIPVMAKCRIGHFAEAQILQQIGIDMIDESEVLTPADEDNHIDKVGFSIPFVCGARNLGEALRRIHEGAAMIRTKGEPGTGNVVEAVRHMNRMNTEISEIVEMKDDEENLARRAEEYLVPVDLVKKTANLGRLPVVNFAAGGISSPSDSALMMQMGCDGIFVGSGIFKSKDPEKFAKAIVEATKHYDEPEVLLKVSTGLGEGMKGIEISEVPKEQRMQDRGV